MRFSDKLGRLPPYLIAETEELASKLMAEGKDLIRLDVGDPDFDTPAHVKKALVKALNEAGMNQYSPYRGIKSLREAIAEKVREAHGVDVDPETEVLITPGSKHAIFSSLQATVDAGTRVLVGAPVYPMFRNVTCFCGGTVVSLPLREELGFRFDVNDLRKKLSGCSVAVLNFPNNPTGGVLEKKDLEEVAEASKGRDSLILYDSAYEKITFGGYEAPFPWEVPELRENTAILGSFSKTYAMTGWRIGYVIAKKETIDRILQVEKISNSCTPMFLQEACAAALRGPQDCVEKMNKEYERRRDALVGGLNSIGIRTGTPKGAFYVFTNVSKYSKSSIEFARKLIEAGVTSVPGLGFGDEGEGYVRFALTESPKRIEVAVSRIKGVIDGISD